MFPDVSIAGLVTFIIMLLIAISVHETAHAYAANVLGDRTARDAGRITLNPLAHVDLLTTVILPIITLILFQSPILAAKPVMINPSHLRYGDFGWALVSVAGPLSNLAMAIAAVLLLRAGILSEQLAVWFAALNVGMFVFNMIPIPPLDGSRLLRAFAPEPLQEQMDRFEGMGFAANLLLIFLLLQFISPVIARISRSILYALF